MLEKVKIHLLVLDVNGPIRGGKLDAGPLSEDHTGDRYSVACRPLHPTLPKYATGEWRATTCPKCMESAAYKAGEAIEKSLLAGDLGELPELNEETTTPVEG